jgi:hypothetical protein
MQNNIKAINIIVPDSAEAIKLGRGFILLYIYNKINNY